MREYVPMLLVLAASTATGCASTTRCPSDRVCGNATWYTAVNGVPLEGRLVVAPLTGVAGAASDGSEAITIGAGTVYLRFDLGAIGDATSIERAVLTLAPHPAWRPSGATRIYARGLLSDWRTTAPQAGAAAVDPDPSGSVEVAGQHRTPVRIDVTSALRAARTGAAPFEGVALTAEGVPAVFAGLASDAASLRPRLEVVVR